MVNTHVTYVPYWWEIKSQVKTSLLREWLQGIEILNSPHLCINKSTVSKLRLKKPTTHLFVVFSTSGRNCTQWHICSNNKRMSTDSQMQIKVQRDEIYIWCYTLFFFLWSVTTADSEWLSQVWQLTPKPLNQVTQQKIYFEKSRHESRAHSCGSGATCNGLSLESTLWDCTSWESVVMQKRKVEPKTSNSS